MKLLLIGLIGLMRAPGSEKEDAGGVQTLNTSAVTSTRITNQPDAPLYDPAKDRSLVAVVNQNGQTVHMSKESADFLIGKGKATLASGSEQPEAEATAATPEAGKTENEEKLDDQMVTGTNVVSADASAAKAEAAAAAKGKKA